MVLFASRCEDAEVDHDKAVICDDTADWRAGAFLWELPPALNSLKPSGNYMYHMQ